MFNAVKFNASQRGTAFGVVFFAFVIALVPTSVYTQCSKIWDASGEWEIRQGRTLITLNLKQSGSALSGTATRDLRLGTRALKGEVIGDADGNAFSLGVSWSDGGFGMYRAQVSAAGKLEGEVFGRNGGKTGEKWYGEQSLTCGWSPGRSRGNLTSGRLSANAPAQPGQSTGSLLKSPVLVASSAQFMSPYNPVGFVVVQWDAGPSHPNAELWVRQNNSRERALLVKQPKGGQQIQVQKNFVYTYILMDGRNVLASTTVVAQ